jgi:hypothetical protein
MIKVNRDLNADAGNMVAGCVSCRRRGLGPVAPILCMALDIGLCAAKPSAMQIGDLG